MQQQRYQQLGLRPRQRRAVAAETIVEESNRRKEQATTRIAGVEAAAARIALTLEATANEAVIALCPHRPSFRREEVMDLLESVTWLGRAVAL